MDGIERVRRAIARDGGYEWCEEHRTYRWWSESSCAVQHASELPRGYFVCEEHGRIHTPAEQAWYCEGEPAIEHPPHATDRATGLPVQPLRDTSPWWRWKIQRRCRKRGGHWWHPADAMIAWFCCQCGAERDGMPRDGS